jgi:hypothetical protein
LVEQNEKKSETRSKAKSRTPRELAVIEAEKFVAKSNDLINRANKLKARINVLPSKDFSPLAIGFNKAVELVKEIPSLAFETTEKADSPTVEATGVTFASLMGK